MALSVATLMAWPSLAWAEPEAHAEHPKAHWRLELNGSGVWLPGHGTFRSGLGLGIGAGYGVLSIGVEYARYELSLHDRLNERFLEYAVIEFLPLVAALHLDLPSLPLRVGLEGAAGFSVGGDGSFRTATGDDRGELPTVLRGRAHLRYVALPLSVGPFVGYTHNLGGGTSSSDGRLPTSPDSLATDYEHPIPFGVELGIGASVWVP